MRSAMNASAGVKGETDYLRRHNNKLINKQKKIRTIKIKSLHILFILTIITFIAFSIYKTGNFLLTWEKLDIDTYKLVNGQSLKKQQVRDILRQYNGNILALNFDFLRKELINIPEVKDVYLSRHLPSTIGIRFVLRQPAFQVEMNEKYTVIDTDGVILYKSNQPANNLITIKNVSAKRQRKLLPYLAQLNTLKDRIEYVGMQNPSTIQVKLRGIHETFNPGETDFKHKIDNYLKIRDKINLLESNKTKIKSVDLRFEDRFYLEYEEEVTQENEK